MSNEYKDWFADRKEDAWDAIGKIATIFQDYHNTDEEVCNMIYDILKEYEFID